jgi:hypothetical protein
MAVRAAVPEEQMGRPVRIEVNVFDGMVSRDRASCRVGEREPWELVPMTGVLHRFPSPPGRLGTKWRSRRPFT